MFWFKRFKRNHPEEIKGNSVKVKKSLNVNLGENFRLKAKDIDYVTDAINKALASRANLFVEFILHKVKNDKEFFEEFMKFLERDQNKRDLLLNIVKINFIESCRKIFSEKE